MRLQHLDPDTIAWKPESNLPYNSYLKLNLDISKNGLAIPLAVIELDTATAKRISKEKGKTILYSGLSGYHRAKVVSEMPDRFTTVPCIVCQDESMLKVLVRVIEHDTQSGL